MLYYCTKKEVFSWGFLQEMWLNSQETSDLVTVAEEILHFLCNAVFYFWQLSIFEKKHFVRYFKGFFLRAPLCMMKKTYIFERHITPDIFLWKNYLTGRRKSRHKISSVKNLVTGKIIRHFLPNKFFAWQSGNINWIKKTLISYFDHSLFC